MFSGALWVVAGEIRGWKCLSCPHHHPSFAGLFVYILKPGIHLTDDFSNQIRIW